MNGKRDSCEMTEEELWQEEVYDKLRQRNVIVFENIYDTSKMNLQQ